MSKIADPRQASLTHGSRTYEGRVVVNRGVPTAEVDLVRVVSCAVRGTYYRYARRRKRELPESVRLVSPARLLGTTHLV